MNSEERCFTDGTFSVNLNNWAALGLNGLAYRADNPTLFANVKEATAAVQKYLILNMGQEFGRLTILNSDKKAVATVGYTKANGYLAVGESLSPIIQNFHWRKGDVVRDSNTGEVYILDSERVERTNGTYGVDCHKHGEDPATWNLPAKSVIRLADGCKPNPLYKWSDSIINPEVKYSSVANNVIGGVEFVSVPIEEFLEDVSPISDFRQAEIEATKLFTQAVETLSPEISKEDEEAQKIRAIVHLISNYIEWDTTDVADIVVDLLEDVNFPSAFVSIIKSTLEQGNK